MSPVNNRPVLTQDRMYLFLFSILAFAIAFGLRAMELPKWEDPSQMVNGEFIMGTHDAYYWLAGAKGVGSAVNNPMAIMIKWLGSFIDAPYGNIAFWLPAVFAGFCAVAAFAWGVLVSGAWAGVVSATYATSVMPYLFRTRLSYYDTDIVTLFFPLLISLLLAKWLKFGIRESWFIKREQAEFKPGLWVWLLPLVAGSITSWGTLWHGDVRTFGLAALAIAVFLTLLCSDKQNRPLLLHGILVYALASFFGLIGIAIASILIVLHLKEIIFSIKYSSNVYALVGLLILVVGGSGVGQGVVFTLLSKVAAYAKPVADNAKVGTAPVYPGIAQSVIEAQNINFSQLFASLTGYPALGWIGLACFAFAVYLRPLLLFILPFAAMIIATTMMGGRFLMFGGMPIGIGLGVVSVWLINKFVKSPAQRFSFAGLQAAMLITILFSGIIPGIKDAPATPIMGDSHAKALIESGKKMDKDGTVWTWWDWGYATMYYSGVNVFANGGHHSGKELFPLGLAFATPSFLQSKQLIDFCSYNKNNPSKAWDRMGAVNSEKMINSFAAVKHSIPKSKKNYIVVSWENIRLAYWILYYGSWKLTTGVGLHPLVSTITKQFNIDYDNGIIQVEGEQPLSLGSYQLLSNSAVKQRSFPDSVGPHLIYNQDVTQGYLVDNQVYTSILLKLLIMRPDVPELKENFRLIYEGFPNVRVYEVL